MTLCRAAGEHEGMTKLPLAHAMALAAARLHLDNTHADFLGAITSAREAGLSWSAIASGTDRSRQSLHALFGRLSLCDLCGHPSLAHRRFTPIGGPNAECTVQGCNCNPGDFDLCWPREANSAG